MMSNTMGNPSLRPDRLVAGLTGECVEGYLRKW